MRDERFDKGKEQKKIIRSFAFYNVGIFLLWCSFVGLLSLQSSINIENGLGMVTLAVTFTVQILCSIFLTPVVIRRHGARTWLIIGDLGVVPYILANLYPRYFTLIPTGIMLAVFQSSLWPSMCLVNVIYATLYSEVSKRPKDVHTIAFTGYFFTAFQISQMCGGLLAYAVLYGFDQVPIPNLESFEPCQPSNTTSENIDIACTSNHSYLYCGARDCQDPEIINETIQQYKPINKISLYVFIGICSVMAIGAAVVHIIFVPNDKTFKRKQEYYTAQMAMLAKDDKPNTSTGDDDKHCAAIENTLYSSSKGDSLFKQSMEIGRSVWRHVLNRKLLLLLPITFYNGLAMGFVGTEMTRSFTSCTVGVQWVGICMAIYGLFDAIFSWIVGKFGRRLGRIALFTIGLILECGNYVYVLVWAPTEYMLFSVLIFYATFGSTDGIFQIIINVTHMDYFPHDEDLAVLVWNTVILMGFAVSHSISPIFCVSVRAYLNIAVLVIGYLCIVGAEFYHRKDQKASQKSATEVGHMQPTNEESIALATDS